MTMDTEPLALALANTLQGSPRGDVDHLAGDGAESWSGAMLSRIGAKRARGAPRGLVELRDAVRRLLDAAADGTRPDAGSIKVVNDAAATPPPILRWGRAPSLAGGSEQLLGALARSAIELLASADRQPLRRCASAPCRRLFLADDPRRVFCSETCGTRARVRRRRGLVT